MAVSTSQFRNAHERLTEHAAVLLRVAHDLPALSPEQRAEELDEALAFLTDEVVPHTSLDELALFPVVNERLRDPLATATMNYDHVAMRGMADDLATADPEDVDRLQELLYGLHAVLCVHVWKEERLYLEMLDRRDWPSG